MSVFAVWGMTYDYALRSAQKKTKSIERNGEIIPESEWLQRTHAAAESIMSGTLIRQLSAKFDAPQFARQFIEIVLRTERHRDLQIRVWKERTNGDGKPVYSKNGKKPRMGWESYVPIKERL